MSVETFITVQKHIGNEAQSSVVGSTSKMNHLPGVFIVRKGRYCQICVLGTCFAQRLKMSVETFITGHKHPGNNAQSSVGSI
jgi:hypothetical protein